MAGENEQVKEQESEVAADEELEQDLDEDEAAPDEDDEAAAAADAGEDGDVAGDDGEGGNGETAAEPTEIDVLKLQLERERDLTEHFRQAHDKLGGKVGPKIQERDRELERLRAENERLRAGRTAEVDDEDEDAPRVPRRLVAEVERLRDRDVERTQRDADAGLRQTSEDFGRKYGDAGDYKDEIMAAVGKSWDAIQALRDQGDVEAARTTLRGVLLESYYGAKERKMTESIRKKADAQTADLRDKKKLNAPVGTSKARAVPTASKHPDRMTKQELEAHFRSQGRKGF